MRNITEKKNTGEMILSKIADFMMRVGYPPSYREIMDETGIKSLATVKYWMSKLTAQGDIISDCDGRSRAYTLKGFEYRRKNEV